LVDQELLQRLVEPHLTGQEPPRFTPIATGKFNDSFWVQAEAGEYVLRIAPPDDTVFLFYERQMMRQEPGIHRVVLAETTVPVAQILAFDDSRQLIDRDYILMERLPGRAWTEAGAVSEARVLAQTGEYLAQVHHLRTGQYGYLGAHRPMAPANSWTDAFVTMWHQLIADIELTGVYDSEEGNWFRKLLDGHLGNFEHDVGSSLLHMDIWHQNLLVDSNGNVTGVVDWDRALWGDPEIEFAVLDYCGISQPAFWEGYGRERDRSPEARLRQLFYLLYELQKYIVIRHGRNRQAWRAREVKRQTMGLLAGAGLSP
jgi:aminoglycoside phosphotransferase (APT) family kinase protein